MTAPQKTHPINMMTDQLLTAEIIKWKQNLKTLPEKRASFQKWFYLNISRVLLGGKTGELTVLKEHRFLLSMDEMLADIENLSVAWGLEVYLFCREETSTKYLVYHRDRAERALKQVNNQDFFVVYNYLPEMTPEEFLQEIDRRWRTNNKVPQEIGFVLGYPVKDVLGFLGLIPLNRQLSCGWQVYGEINSSLELKAQYDAARERAVQLLQ